MFCSGYKITEWDEMGFQPSCLFGIVLKKQNEKKSIYFQILENFREDFSIVTGKHSDYYPPALLTQTYPYHLFAHKNKY